MQQGSAADEYRTVDSNHAGYVSLRSRWVAPAFLAIFAAVAAGIFLAMPELLVRYTGLLQALTGAAPSTLEVPQSLGFRPFFLLLLVQLAAFIGARWYHRVVFTALAAGLAGATTVGLDVLLVTVHELGGPAPFGLAGSVINGFAMLLLSPAVFLSAHHTPPAIKVPTQRRRSWRYSAALIVGVAAGGALTLVTLIYLPERIDRARDVGLLGGLGPGIVLLIPMVQLVFFGMGLVGRAAAGACSWAAGWFDPRERQQSFGHEPPSVAFLVPAYNEAETIAECLLSIDLASRGYPQRPRVYVVDNASTDATAEVARATFAQLEHVEGVLVDCPTPGKSHALNVGLARMTESIMIRVDSDSLLADDVLPRVMQHFKDPSVGGVGGLALPLQSQALTLMGRVRAIEVYHAVGMVRMAQATVDAVMVLPGQLSAYRRDVIVSLGGFAVGINGEDTDLTVRVGRAGWRIVMDPGIRLYSETPRNLPHLHEQRLRWSRSLVHVYTRNISALWQLQGVRALWLLPLGLLGAVRRAAVPLLIIYALASLAIAPETLFVRDGAALLAVLAGPPAILALAALVAYRRFDLVLYLPGYAALRLFRAYVMLEALLTMRHISLPRAAYEAEPALASPASAPRGLAHRRGFGALLMLGSVAAGALLASAVLLSTPRFRTGVGEPAVLVASGQPGEAATGAAAAASNLAAAAPVPPSLSASSLAAAVLSTRAARVAASPVDADGAAAAGAARVVDVGGAPLEFGPPMEGVEVLPGDSLEAIARRHGSTAEVLARYNDIADVDRIKAGSWLLVPAVLAAGPNR